MAGLKRAGVVLVLVVPFLLAGCNLAGDVTPPPGSALIRPPATQAPAAPAALAPPSQPDPAAGEAIYAERCAPCHGEGGQGDGEQAGQLPVPPAALADLSLAAGSSPADWYLVVTEGRIDQFMPPFASLTDQQRWDVVAYSLTLSVPAGSIETAQALYADHCAECHAPQGGGAERGPALTGLASYGQRSRAETAQLIAAGMGSGMPGFGGALSEAEIQELAALVQLLPLESEPADGGAPAVAPSADPEAPAEAATSGSIQGRLIDGVSGEPVSDSLEVTLHAFDGQQEVLTETVTARGAAGYSIDGLEVIVGRLYVVTAEYDGVRYSSEVAHLTELGEAMMLDVPVFPATSDPAQIAASRVHLLLDQPADGRLRAVELWLLVNLGEQTVVPVDGQGGVEIALPPQASNLQFESGQLEALYQPTDDGFRLLTPIRPGSEAAQVVFSFDLNLDGTLTVRQPLTVPVQTITVLVAEGGPTVTADNMIDRGVREAGGEQLHQYDLGPFRAGDSLELRLQPAAWWSQIDFGSQGYAGLLGLVVLAAVVIALVRWYRPWLTNQGGAPAADQTASETTRDREALLQAIADLDEAFEAGQIAAEAHQPRRAALKAALIEAMKAERD